MRHWAEGVLAVALVLGFGLALFLYSGESLADGGPGTTEPPVVVDPEAAARGQVLANGSGCLACHTVDGSSATGPTWKGLAGSERPLTTGEFVTADDAYLFNSIVDPSSQVVQGFDDVMPSSFSDQLTEAEIDDLIAYITSLG
jgi:cytochrome c oxidase subunit 2